MDAHSFFAANLSPYLPALAATRRRAAAAGPLASATARSAIDPSVERAGSELFAQIHQAAPRARAPAPPPAPRARAAPRRCGPRPARRRGTART